MINFLEQKDCEICGSKKNKKIYSWKSEYYDHKKYETYSWDGGKKISLSIVKCQKCGLVFTNPSFNEKGLSLIYPENLILEKNENIDKIFNVQNKKFLSIMSDVMRFRKKGVLLDIGTRYGVLPWIANKKGFDSYGLEFNSASVAFGKKKFKNIFEGTIKNLPKMINDKKIKRPDIIILDDVLEHLIHPKADLKILSELQKSGGLLFLRQMNYGSLGRKIFGRHWYYFQPAAHQFYFDKKTIGNLLEATGYKIIETKINISLRPLLSSLKSILTGITGDIFGRKAKKSYLTNKLRSGEDIFLVIAVKK